MDNYNHPHPMNQQPNGSVHRPQSHMRQPPMRVNDVIEEDEFEPQPPPPPGPLLVANGSIPTRDNPQGPPPQEKEHKRGQRDHKSHVTRSMSRDKDLANTLPKILKIAVVGDSTVGKTCLCNAVTSESYNFNKNYQLTCGVSVYPKSVKLPDQEGAEERVNMALLDSSGKDIYVEYLPKYWDKLDGVIVVVDLTSPTSLNGAGEWLKIALKCVGGGAGGGGDSNPSLRILIGNKVDLVERRAISPQMAQDFAAKHNLQYFECSVKDNSGLEEPFFYIAHQFTVESNGNDGKWN